MKQLLLLIAFISISLFAISQQKIVVEIGEKEMSKGQQMAIIVKIPEARAKDAEPVWKTYINNRSIGERFGNLTTQIGNIFRSDSNKVSRDRLRVEKKGDEWYIRSVEESNITSHPMDVYARATDLPDGCLFSAFFQYTDSIFINESNVDQERIQNMKSFIHDFAVEAYKSVVDDQIKEAKNEVSKQKKILRNIESNSRKQEKSIARNEVDIQEYDGDIDEIQNDIKRLVESIETQKFTLGQYSREDPEYEDTRANLKDLAKEKSKKFRKIKSLKSRIKSKEMDIKASKKKISKNEILVDKQQTVVDDKETIVDNLEDKKNNIE